MSDSRVTQMRALTDELRTLAFKMLEERPVHALTRVQYYSRWTLLALDDAEKELA